MPGVMSLAKSGGMARLSLRRALAATPARPTLIKLWADGHRLHRRAIAG
jgi:hypothetical protein